MTPVGAEEKQEVMRTTLRFNDNLYREAKAEAARRGLTVTRFIEDALRAQLDRGEEEGEQRQQGIEEWNRLMDALLQRTAHFRIGPKATRKERNER